MSNETRNPTPPGDRPALDRLLTTLGRLSPRPGFEERVLALVRIPLPAWARRLRDGFRGLTSGVRGWVLLGTMSLATATAWGGAVWVAFRYRHEAEPYVSRGGRIVLSRVVDPVWQELTANLAARRDALEQMAAGALGGLPVSWQALVLGYGALALMSAVALRILVVRHARSKG